MLRSRLREFIRDESGGYTVWSLTWFALYVGIGGLAVDVTDAYRNRTQLQATADTAALAGVMSLPDTAKAVSAAVGFAEYNMTVGVNGHVVNPDEVLTGNWDTASETFTAGGAPLNAVYVMTRRADENANPLATNFLRIFGLWGSPFDRFNINTEAVAMEYVSECLLGSGFVAGNMLSIQSNNASHNTCFHAQNLYPDNAHQNLSVDLSNQNSFGVGSVVSMPLIEGGLDGRSNLCQQNPTLCDPGVLVEGDMWPEDVKRIDAIIGALRNGEAPFTPPYMFENGTSPVIHSGDPASIHYNAADHVKYNESFNGPYVSGHVYDIRCSNGSKTLKLPKDPLDKVVIVTNCKLGGANGGTIVHGVIASSAVGNASGSELDANTISLAGNWNFGNSSFCTSDRGMVAIYAKASAHIAAGTTIYGLRIVVGGNLDFTANGSIYGISAQAGYDIAAATSNGSFDYCGGKFDPLVFAKSYRLVR